MAGTTNITQTRPSYTCQSITSTGPGESALNALETIAVESIAEDAIATIAPTGEFYEWVPTSVAAPGVGVVIPLGQNILTPGRWIKLTSLPVGVVYNQFIEGLPLATTLAPEYDPLVAAIQQPILRFTNGNVSDGAGHTDVTLEYQQVWSEDALGAKAALPQRARLRFKSSSIVSGVPLTVVDEPGTDTTLVTIHPSAGGGITKIFDVSLAPYLAVPYSYAAAAWNTARIQMAIDDAKAVLGGAVWLPGVFDVAWSGNTDAAGNTYALDVGTDPVTILGPNRIGNGLKYNASAGAYGAVIIRAEGANINTDAYAHDHRFEEFSIDCHDTVAASVALYGLRIRKGYFITVDRLLIETANIANLWLDYCYSSNINDTVCKYGLQHGIALGPDNGTCNRVSVTKCSLYGNVGFNLFLRGSDNLSIIGNDIQGGYGGGIILIETGACDIIDNYFEQTSLNGTAFTGDPTTRFFDIACIRGGINKSVPTAWTYAPSATFNGTPQALGYNNPSLHIQGNYTNELAGVSFVGGNAYEDMVLESNFCNPTIGTPALSYWADGTVGVAQPFSIRPGNDGFAAPVPLLFAWGGSLANVANTEIAGTPSGNLLPQDLLYNTLARIPSDAAGHLYTGELSISATQSYQGGFVYQLTGANNCMAKCMTIDIGAHPELANKVIVISALCYADGTSPTNSVGFNFKVGGGANQNPTQGNGDWVVGWNLRSVIYQLPGSGIVYIGFTKYGTGTALFAKPAVTLLGNPYSKVSEAWVGANSSGITTYLAMQFQFATAEAKDFNANGATTVAGVPCYMENYTYSSPDVSVQADGTGLLFSPIQAAYLVGGAPITAPSVGFLLSQLIPNYNLDMEVWAIADNDFNNASAPGQHAAAVMIWPGVTLASGSPNDTLQLPSGGTTVRRGGLNFGAGTYGIANWFFRQAAGAATIQNETVALIDGTTELLTVKVNGVATDFARLWYGAMGADANSQPVIPDTNVPAVWTPGTGSIPGFTTANARVSIGAARDNSGLAFITKFRTLLIQARR